MKAFARCAALVLLFLAGGFIVSGCKKETKPVMKTDKIDPPAKPPISEGSTAPGLSPKGP